MNSSAKKERFRREDLVGVRCLCIFGIMMSHSFAPYLFSSGQIWRVPTLFFLAGFALTRDRKIFPTLKYIFISFYGYVVIFSIIYLAFLTLVLAPHNVKFLHGATFQGVFFSDIFKRNLHANSLLLACWFLIPMAVALIVSIALMQFLKPSNILLAILGGTCLVTGFAIAQPTAPDWPVRLVGHSLLGLGYLLIGGAMFRSDQAIIIIKKGWFIVASLTLALTIETASAPFSLTWSWMSARGNHWLALPTSLLYLPALLWLGERIANNPTVQFIGNNTKHIMAHHLFGFLILNLVLSALGYVSVSEIGPFTVIKHTYLWPLYLLSGLLWSLIVVKIISLLSETIIARHQFRAPA